ncbi:MAG TPA: cellulase family glycosylhydrolase [Hyphomonadaceae bacterium]|nr:cellulase family glycosylhydrolase [Hyphomonadaceae bacterium]
MKRFPPTGFAENPHGIWTRRAVIAAGAGLAAMPAAAQTGVHPLWPVSGPPVLRGAVIAQRRRRQGVDGDTFGGGGPVLPAYGGADFDALVRAGANLVVMSFPELWTVAKPWKPDPVMAVALYRQIELAKAAGLNVIVALRSGPGRSDFVFHRDAAGTWFPANLIVDSIWTDAEAQAAWADMCVDIAKGLAGRAEIAGLNIMVEPDPNVSGTNKAGQRLGAWTPAEYSRDVSDISDWRRISASIAQKVRAAAPDLPILISPPAFARTDFLAVMGQPPVKGTVWCVHDYEPRDYTHSPKESRGIPVFGEGGDNTFARRLDAAKKQGAPVFLGEFGAARWLGDNGKYYRARISACEQRGVAWAAFRWPTGDAAYEASDDMFNLGWGMTPGREEGAALPVLREAWARNASREAVGLRGRAALRGRKD